MSNVGRATCGEPCDDANEELQPDQDLLFRAGDYVLLNRMDPPPPAPAEDASPEEVLRYQRESTWVGRIQQAKAESEQKVMLRVFWLYWPEELPMGSQPYHGHSELVMSNYTDIIDATSIASAAEISHWNEWDDSIDDRPLNSLFWRQTFDVSKLGKNGKGGLSNLRKHCICQEEYNPDTTMYQCSRKDCSMWNHSGCLHRQLMEDLWGKFQKSALTDYLDHKAAALESEKAEKKTSIGEALIVGAGKAMSTMMHVIERGSEAPANNERKPSKVKTANNTPSKKQRKQAGSQIIKDERIQVVIESADAAAGSGMVVAKVKLLPDKASKSKEPQEWTIKLDCLNCRSPLD